MWSKWRGWEPKGVELIFKQFLKGKKCNILPLIIFLNKCCCLYCLIQRCVNVSSNLYTLFKISFVHTLQWTLYFYLWLLMDLLLISCFSMMGSFYLASKETVLIGSDVVISIKAVCDLTLNMFCFYFWCHCFIDCQILIFITLMFYPLCHRDDICRMWDSSCMQAPDSEIIPFPSLLDGENDSGVMAEENTQLSSRKLEQTNYCVYPSIWNYNRRATYIHMWEDHQSGQASIYDSGSQPMGRAEVSKH